jgi:hypothetical protein
MHAINYAGNAYADNAYAGNAGFSIDGAARAQPRQLGEGNESAFWDINVSAGFVDLAPQCLQFFRRHPARPSGAVRSALPAITLVAILLLIGLAPGPVLLPSLLLVSPTSSVVAFPIGAGTGDCSCHACHPQ